MITHQVLVAVTGSGIAGLTKFIATGIYLALFAIALWGAYNVIMVWIRVAQNAFVTRTSKTNSSVNWNR